jgi:hypothetical protein
MSQVKEDISSVFRCGRRRRSSIRRKSLSDTTFVSKLIIGLPLQRGVSRGGFKKFRMRVESHPSPRRCCFIAYCARENVKLDPKGWFCQFIQSSTLQYLQHDGLWNL